MQTSDFKVTIWGTQGSTAVNSPKNTRHGSNTPCVCVECKDEVFLFDMGTGMIAFSQYFLKKYKGSKTIHVFLSHYHLDHIEGLPFAGLTYAPYVELCFHGWVMAGKPPQEILSTVFSPPYFPAHLLKEQGPDRFTYDIVERHRACLFHEQGIIVENFPVLHPGGALSYKLSYQGRSFCYLSDFEYDGKLTPEMKAYLKGCDLVAFDAYFSNSTLRPGWGHSTWEQGVEIWQEAGFKRMVMCHHHISCTDEELDSLNSELMAISPDLFVATEGMELYI